MWTVPSQSSRTHAYLISQGHRYGHNTSSRTYEYETRSTRITEPTYKFKDIWIFKQQFISECLHYTVTHFHCHRSWDSFPTDLGGGTSRQLLHAVPSSHRSWDHFFPLARGGGTNRLSWRTTHSTVAESPTECQSKKTTLTTWEQDQMYVKPIQIWKPGLMNISYEHFRNNRNVTKQAS